MSVVKQLAFNLKDIHLEGISKKVLLATRYNLLDAIGCGLFGSNMPESKNIISAFSEFSNECGSPVWGTPYNLSPDNAAMICGSFCHMRELDDVHYAVIHPGAVCVPAAFSVAHHKQKTLGDLLLAILCGIETMARIAKGINFLEHSRRGWHTTATCGPFGAAVAAGKLINLDEVQMSHALGLAGSRTGGVRAYVTDGAMSKRLHPGLAAKDGILSAYLAAVGITGPSYILESKDGGIYNLTSSGWDLNPIAENIGKAWAIEEMEYKWYPSCKSVHSPLEAAKLIHEAYKYRKIEDITRVLVEVNLSALDANKMYNPESVISAQLSIPYGVAIGLLGRNGGIDDYDTAYLKDPTINSLANKVQINTSVEFDRLRAKEHKSGAKVTIFWKDGTMASKVVDSPKGSVGKPLTEEDIEEKFINLSGRILVKEQVYNIIDLITKAPTSLPVREISKLLKI